MSDAIVLKRPIVRIDLAGCYAHIWEHSPDSANRFRHAAEATLTALAKTPGIGEPYQATNPHLAGLRRARVRRFKNYLIFYRPILGGIDVIRVLHAARDVRDILEAEENDTIGES
jgi:toxin ParE1/3/4